ncbi:hypothetical protein AB0G20_28615 [Streptomyces sp. NPDC024017]|uniref:hypothetical protein n=1 Tax=Streptomyces sp. NPDC024017 TaxID=3154326 RepID=UPI0033C0B24D
MRVAAHRYGRLPRPRALACQLYLEGGIRSVELGSLYLGSEDENGTRSPQRPTSWSGSRFPAGRTASAKDKERIPGYRLVEQPPLLRHFRCKLEPVPS